MKLIWVVLALFSTTLCAKLCTTAAWAHDTEAATKSKIIALEQLWNHINPATPKP